MADIFISYARSTGATQAQAVVQALRALGYGVWIDDAIPAHRAYTDVIEEELKAAAAVVVLWSTEAVKSQWVQSEADHARAASKLVQLNFDGAVLPMPFDRIQCADLRGWPGDLAAPGWKKVVASIEDLARPLAGTVRRVTARAPSPIQAAPVTPERGAAARWGLIERSLDPEDYADFLAVFPDAEEAFEARHNKRKLEAWAKTDQADAAAVAAFLRSGSYPALHAVAQAVATRLAAEEEQARSLRIPAWANWTHAREAAMAKRPAIARSFGIELPDVANHLRTVMVALPPGHFSMGSPDTEEGHDVAEAPMHEVQIDYVFAIGAVAVTRDVFSIFIDDAGYEMGESAYVFEDARWVVVRGRGWRDPGFAQNGDHPVTCVSWRDAQAFLVWLNDRVGLTGQPGVYRLPSEAEWEYACRGGTSTPFSFGDTLNTDQANFNGRLTYGGAEASMLWRKATTPAGHLSANGFGVHDAHGNVWEWCDDVWNANYEGVPATGAAQLTGDLSARVRRGGCWDTGPHLCRSATRFRGDPQYRGSNTGFRLARTLS